MLACTLCSCMLAGFWVPSCMFKRTSSFSPPYVGEGPQASSSLLSVISRMPVNEVVPSTWFLDAAHSWWTSGCPSSDPHTRYASYLCCVMLNKGIWISTFVMRCTPISTYLVDTGHRWWTWESLFIDPHSSYASNLGCFMLIQCICLLSLYIWM